ncbi:hypothetical protein Ahy_A08g040333 isoform D [Arachis hypogaea]|uniref:Uncharacterized protein n=1 Tax=Arachis hypogaea TaxID=3818 RepID=A0A445BYX4_ARAHY|nr:hypothetical protein Ahy_A08g040333 isoform D [Arachis hypogaea]
MHCTIILLVTYLHTISNSSGNVSFLWQSSGITISYYHYSAFVLMTILDTCIKMACFNVKGFLVLQVEQLLFYGRYCG